MITNSPTEKEIQEWEQALGRTAPPEIAWLSNGKALVGFFNYTGCDIELAIHGKGKWATPNFIAHCFSYIYNQLGVQRSTVRVLEKNQPSIKLVTRLGYQLEGILRKALKNENVLVFGMLKNECSWI